MDHLPQKIWWTPQEIAEANLPDLPNTKRGVQKLVERFDWRSDADMARRRAGRGGGWEYSWRLFPASAQRVLLSHRPAAVEAAPERRAMTWDEFERATGKAQDEARRRHECLTMVEGLVAAGMVKRLAVISTSELQGVSEKTIWNWFKLVDGVAPENWLPALAPKKRGSKAGNNIVEYSEDFWEMIKSNYLRPRGPKLAVAYRHAMRVAKVREWVTTSYDVILRRKKQEVPRQTEVLAREGLDGLKKLYPTQTRDRMSLHALEAVNADYHRFDVFVLWPAEPGAEEGEIVRPQLVVFHDIYSGRILSWRIDKTPNKVGVSLALGDMIERFGIPYHVTLDNGREFANKFLTGGTKTRFRFKIKDDDIPGILTTLGVQVHWATPYSGQSKPVERAFRDLAEDVSKDPRLAGAYTGHRPDAKPEDYGSRAIPLEKFISVLEEGIAEHNARTGRRGQTTNGRSFLETFEQSYATAPIRKATEEQRRFWLMGAEGVRADRKTGLIRFMGNEYYSDWMIDLAGQKVVVRFDPADLRSGLHVYSLDNSYLGHADCRVAAGFYDIEEARLLAAARRKMIKAEKAALDAHRKFSARELGAMMDEARPGSLKSSAPEAKVVRPTFARKPMSTPKPVITPEQEAQRAALVASFEEKRSQKPVAKDTPRERFAKALELEARIAAGEAVHRDQERWLSSYQSTPEYKAEKKIRDAFNKDASG